MITPVKRGEDLLREIEQTNSGNDVAIWWLGQSGFAIKTGQTTAYIDLYLSEHLTSKYKDSKIPHIRMTDAPFRGGDIRGADIALSSHRHSDHMDRPTITALMENNPEAKYIFPAADVEYVSSWGLELSKLLPAKVDQPIEIGNMTIIPQPAKHENFDYSDRTGYPYMSYIIKTGRVTLYHSGDTLPYPGLLQRLEKHGVDVLLLPINGRGGALRESGISGNFTMQEALCFAELLGVRTLIPHHYEMFTFNTANIAEFSALAAQLYPALDCCVLKCGECKLL